MTTPALESALAKLRAMMQIAPKIDIEPIWPHEAAALLALIERSFDGDYRLPCDVKVAPATIIGKGCPLSTLMTSIKQREGVDVLRMVNPASVAAYRNPQPAGGGE